MIASMTGYGKASYTNSNIKISVDIKSINSKQLDLMLRLPSVFREQETYLRNKLSPLLERGKVEITVNYEDLAGQLPVKLNTEILKTYKTELEELSKTLDLPLPTDLLPILLRLPEAMKSETYQADESEKNILFQVAESAAEELMDSRIQEGRGLYDFFFEKISRIRQYLEMTEKYETGRVSKIREKLETQLSRLQGVEIDRGRLEQELIFYIEKLDVTEEKQRLSSHLDYFAETLGEPDETNVGGKGKKLGFISQEIGREINTLGSKSNDADMQKIVVMMKDELEQIKEQVLNVL
ncbi:MAG: YicC family protein [Muribaculaceae bacterium]|nr:YicC family protein [Muribaculaceae bacterium]